jgi:hypothetical protein
VPEEYYTSDQDYMTSEWYGTDEEYEERLSRTVRDIGRFAKLTLSAPEVPVNLPANNVIGALKDYPDVWEEGSAQQVQSDCRGWTKMAQRLHWKWEPFDGGAVMKASIITITATCRHWNTSDLYP